MNLQTQAIETKIAALRANYTRLALQCKAAGMRVNPATVESYLQEIKRLQTQLN